MSEVGALAKEVFIEGLPMEIKPVLNLSLPRSEIIKQRYRYEQLTKKEKEVLLLLFKDLPQSKISSELGIRLNTLKTHRKKIYSKLNFANKSALILWGQIYLAEFFS